MADDDYRPTGAVREALRSIFAFKAECMDEDRLVSLFVLADKEWDSFPSLLVVVLTDTTKEVIANAYQRSFGAAIPRRTV